MPTSSLTIRRSTADCQLQKKTLPLYGGRVLYVVRVSELLPGFPSVPHRLVVCLDKGSVVGAVAPVADLCRVGDGMESIFHETCHHLLDAMVHFGNARLGKGAFHAERDDLIRMTEVARHLVLVHDLRGFLRQRSATEAEQHEQNEDSQQHDRLPFWLRRSQPSVHTIRHISYFVDYKKNKKTRGKISHQKKFSCGAKSDCIGVPGLITSVAGNAWKLKIMMSIDASAARISFFPKP